MFLLRFMERIFVSPIISASELRESYHLGDDIFISVDPFAPRGAGLFARKKGDPKILGPPVYSWVEIDLSKQDPCSILRAVF